MKYYAIAELTLTSNDWLMEYVTHVTPLVERFGGKFLARTSQVDMLEGSSTVPQSFTIIEFPSRNAFEEFYESDDYQPYLKLRQTGSHGDFYLVAGEDFARK